MTTTTTSRRMLLLGALTAAPLSHVDSFTAHPQRSSTFIVGRGHHHRSSPVRLLAISEDNNNYNSFNDNNNANNNNAEDGNGGGFFDGLSKLADSLTGNGPNGPSPTDLESTTQGIAATATDMYSESLSQLVNADAESASEYLESVQAQMAAAAAVSPQRALFNDDSSLTRDNYSLVSDAPRDVFITPINGNAPPPPPPAVELDSVVATTNVVPEQASAVAAADVMANADANAAATAVASTTAAAASPATTTMANAAAVTTNAAVTPDSWSTSPSNTVVSFPSSTNELIEHAEKLSTEMNTVINEIDAVLAGKTVMESDVLAAASASATAAATVAAPPVVAAAVSSPPPETLLSSPAAAAVTASIGDSAMDTTTSMSSAVAANDVMTAQAATAAASITTVTDNDVLTFPTLSGASNPLPTATTTTTPPNTPNPLNKLMSQVATNANESLHTVQDGLTAQATTQAQGLNHAIGNALDVSKGRVVEQGNVWSQSGVKVVSGVAAGSTAAVQNFGEKSLADLGSDVVHGLQFVGHSMENGINMILGQLDYEHDTTLHSLVSGAQHSVDEAVKGAISSIMTTLSNIGHTTLEQLATSFIQLLVTVVKFVFVMVSAVIQMLSGKGLDEWTMATIQAVEREATTLSTQASTAIYDATHTSLADLGTSVGHFSHDVGQLVVQTIGILGHGLETAPGQLADLATLAGTM